MKDKRIDSGTARLIGRIARITLFIIATMVLLNSMGIDISGVVTLGSVGTLVVGFASKNLLANFLGGVTLHMDKPFRVGEWIRMPGKNIEGVVEDIGFRLTRVRTFDQRPLYVPNDVFATNAIENPGRMRNRRIKEIVGVRYDDATKLPKILEDIRQMLKDHPEIDQKRWCMVHFVHFGESTLDIQIYTFTKITHWQTYLDIQEDVFLKIIAIIEGHGAECAFPTRTLHMASEATTPEPANSL